MKILYYATFLILMVSARFVFPFTDEPDFPARSAELLGFRDTLLFNPYQIFGNIINIDDSIKDHQLCIIKSSTLSLWPVIGDGCTQDWQKLLMRAFYNIFMLSPFLLLLIGPNKSNSFISKGAVLISLLFPGVIYYLGLFTNEQFSLILSLIATTYLSRSKLIIFILCIFIFILDSGNSVVFIMVVAMYYLNIYLNRYLSLKKIALLSLAFIMLCYSLNTAALDFFNSLPIIGQKAQAMTEQLDGSVFYEKYPLFLRPVITYMTFVYMSPAYIKSIPLYLFFPLFVFYAHKKRNGNNECGDNRLVLFLLAFITSTLSLVYMFPTYGNAKYYIFAFPAVTQYLINRVGEKSTYIFYTFLSLFLFLNIAIYTI
ncbi:TPA: hypothetical protein L9B17_004681 [Klebsiella quasipneumoniae]|nr:hypothetical protein [Klebsiella quasipneumoniae]